MTVAVDDQIRALEKVAATLAVSELERIAEESAGDPEAAHSEADEVLCELLKTLGYENVVKAWQSVEKWYA